MELKDVVKDIPTVSEKVQTFNGNRFTINEADANYYHTDASEIASETMSIQKKVKRFIDKNFDKIVLLFKLTLLLGYFVYFGFALNYHIGDEGSWRLIACTAFGAWLIVLKLLKKTGCYRRWTAFWERVYNGYKSGKRSFIIRWVLYVAMTVFMVTYVVIFIAIKTPENLRSLFGLFGYPLLLFIYSNNKRKVNWHTVYWSMSLQFIMALLILKTSWGASIISWSGKRLEEFVANGKAGSVFIFGQKYYEHYFAFGAMVQVFCVIVGMSVLTYLGVIKFVVESAGRVLAFFLGTSAPEGINAVGNIFLHVPESAMLIQEYIADMTPSQLFVTYAGGLSTVGGVSLIIFMSTGVCLWILHSKYSTLV